MSFVKSAVDSLTGKTAERKARQAAGVAAGAQEQALEYLQEREQLPREISEAALQQLGGLYGLTEGGDRAAFVESLRQDPFYQQMLESGEEAVLRGASATGGLRSGAANRALAESSQDVLGRLYAERVGGLAGLASQPSYAPQIAQYMAGVGGTEAAGITAGAQARESGLGNILGGAATLYGELGGLKGITSGIKRGIGALL